MGGGAAWAAAHQGCILASRRPAVGLGAGTLGKEQVENETKNEARDEVWNRLPSLQISSGGNR